MDPHTAPNDFPSTRWSRILLPAGRRDLDALVHAYERPIRTYLAACQGRGGDLDDLAQDAFAWLLTSGLLDKADPQRGRFRGFLKRSLRNFVSERHRRAQAQKRGGSLTVQPVADADEPVDGRERAPDAALDDAWRRELLQTAQARLRDELLAKGHEIRWRVFADYFLTSGDEPDHATLAARHGITRTDVANWLDRARQRYRALLHAAVAETVADPEALRDELDWLFGRDGGGRG